ARAGSRRHRSWRRRGNRSTRGRADRYRMRLMSLELQEDRLAFALKADVETVRGAALGHGDQRVAAVRVEPGQQRVGRERRRVVRQVDPGEQVEQQTARAHADTEVRGVASPGAGAQGADVPVTVGVGLDPAETSELHAVAAEMTTAR